VLTTTDGTVVARLTPGREPTAGPHIAPSNPEPPVLTAELKAALAAPKPLPPALTPATHDRLLGAWVSALPRPSSGLRHDTEPGITFAADGSYHGTDGCNGTDGRWASDDTGALIITGGASAAMGCDNVDVVRWVGLAAWAALDHGALVLVGPDGAETGRLKRA
jgi:hypothetical protein